MTPFRSPLLALSFVVALSSAAGAQAPNLQPSQLLPGAAVIGPAAGNQKSPAIAKGSSTSLLVFEDTRAGNSDLFGVRLDASGASIDSVPFPITKDPGNQTAPKVSWNGQSWLVVYSNEVDPGTGYFAYQFAALRVSPQGQVLDSAPIAIFQDDSGGNFAIGSDGQNWTVTYTGYSAGNSGIGAKRISAAGTVLDSSGVVVFPATYYVLGGLNVTFAANEYLLTWQDNGMRGRRFDSQLQPIDPAPVLVHNSGINNDGGNAITTNGSEFFIAWARETPLFLFEVVGTRLDANLNVMNAAPITISGASPSVNFFKPLVVWDGAQWIVSWTTPAESFEKVARVSAAGVCLDPGGVTIPDNNPSYLYATALGALPAGGVLVAWHDIRFAGSSLYDLFGTTFSGAGVAGTERCYGIGAEALRGPRVAPGPNNYLVTYRAELANGTRVLAQRVDAFGAPIDAVPIEVASASHSYLFAGGAAWNGSVFLVAWNDSNQGKIFARRMLPNGAWLDPAPIFVLLGDRADVAALGDDFLVTGLRAPANPQFVGSYGARVRGSDGVVLDNPALSIGQSYATRARVAALGGKWLVVTERHFTHDSNQSNVVFHFVTTSGVVSSEAIAASAVNIQDWGSIDVATSGASALIVCQSGSNWTNTDVFGRRVLSNGSMPAPLLNLTGSVGGGQSKASVGWNGSEYVVAYETLQNNVWGYDLEPDIYAVRVSETGSPIDAAGFALWTGEGYEVNAESSGLAFGKSLFAASTYVDGAFGSFRISIRGMRPAGLANYGAGTAGCAGPQRMDASGPPKVGDATFTLFTDRAPAGALGLVLVSNLQDVVGSDPLGLGILFHIGFIGANTLVGLNATADSAGNGAAPLPLPGNPSTVGLHFYAQSAWSWSACSPSPFGLSTSDGLEIVLQAP